MIDTAVDMMTDEELDELDSALLSLPTGDDAMFLSEFDGFCAGLITCPEVVMPGEWLPCIWGSEAQPFETDEMAQRIIDMIMRHYNDVAAALTPPVLDYAPIYDVDTSTDDVLWESWVSGFERAMRLRPGSWEQIVESDDEEAASSVNMMLALSGIAEGQSDLPASSIKALNSEAPDLIPNLVLTINGWTKGLSRADAFPAPFAANHSQQPFRRDKVGRNEPCPCGSGRKYKRCCGSN